jgi:hypothetical protein
MGTFPGRTKTEYTQDDLNKIVAANAGRIIPIIPEHLNGPDQEAVTNVMNFGRVLGSTLNVVGNLLFGKVELENGIKENMKTNSFSIAIDPRNYQIRHLAMVSEPAVPEAHFSENNSLDSEGEHSFDEYLDVYSSQELDLGADMSEEKIETANDEVKETKEEPIKAEAVVAETHSEEFSKTEPVDERDAKIKELESQIANLRTDVFSSRIISEKAELIGKRIPPKFAEAIASVRNSIEFDGFSEDSFSTKVKTLTDLVIEHFADSYDPKLPKSEDEEDSDKFSVEVTDPQYQQKLAAHAVKLAREN